MLHKDYFRKGPVEKKTLAVGLKGLDAKKNCLPATASRKVTLILTSRFFS
jgi:hypothetical protein